MNNEYLTNKEVRCTRCGRALDSRQAVEVWGQYFCGEYEDDCPDCPKEKDERDRTEIPRQ